MKNNTTNTALKKHLRTFILSALLEDAPQGDHTSLACIPYGTQGKAELIAKDNGVLAGVELSEMIFRLVSPKLKILYFKKDGDHIRPGDTILTVQGSEHAILKAERIVLNFMQRMSGIATLTSVYVNELKGTKCKLLDTRKTTPGFREIEKWAVRIGGGCNHRFSLSDMIMIKDNHIDFAGGIDNAIVSVKQYLKENKLKLKVEIETRNISELKQVLLCGGVDRIMLDNFSIPDLKKAVKMIAGKYETEASGGITLENIRSYALCGVDYISSGALTHSYKSLDMSLKAQS